MNWRGKTVVCVLMGLAAGAECGADTWYVSTNGNDTTGDSWPNAFLTISNATARANTNAGDLVLISNGVHYVTQEITVSNGVTCRGFSGDPADVVVAAAASVRCFYLAGANLADLTVTNGYPLASSRSGDGGGIYSFGNCSVSNCVFTGNICPRYGGGASFSAGATVADCVFVGNRAAGTASASSARGGGAYINTVQFLRNVVRANFSGYAGGGLCVYGSPVVSNCLIVENTTTNSNSGGGGMYDNSSATFIDCQIISNRTISPVGVGSSGGGSHIPGQSVYSNCVFAFNVNTNGAGYGGGVNLGGNAGTISFYSCLFYENQGYVGAGACLNNNSRSAWYNCTFATNWAGSGGGAGLYVRGSTSVTGSVVNCIMYGNVTASVGSNYYVGAGGTATFTNCCALPSLAAYGPGNIAEDPLFRAPGEYDFRLSAGSQCINAGLNQAWMLAARDLGGTNARILYSRVDLGALEYTNGSLSCTFTADPLWAQAPSTNIFTAIVDGTNQDSLYYRWDFTADGTVETEGLGLGVVTNVYTNAGYYSVALTASNAAGEIAGWTNACYIKAGPVTYYVATNGGHVFPYTNWAMAASNAIQTAVDAANDRDTVIVSNGTYGLTAPVSIASGVLLQGYRGWANTVIDGNGTMRCFYLNHTNAALSGFTISNGYVSGANHGGGVYLNLGGMVSNCVIRNCRANRDGGGAYLYAGGLLRNCLIVTNVSSNGGGVCSYQTGLVQNCTIVGNAATNWSGGIYASSTGGVFQNCIIYSNYADSGIGPNWCTNNVVATAPPTRFVFTNCCTFPTNDLPGLNNIAAEPGFIDSGGGNFRLGSSSPGVDAGANQDEWMLAGIDLDGQSRIFNTVVDIGAFERSLFDAAAAPANVQASDGTYVDQVRVTWETNACTNATGYQVFRSLAADPAGADQLSDVSDASYADTSATNGVLYYYWVRATNAYAVSDLSVSNTGFRAIAPPTGVTASDGTFTGKVVVTWETNVCTNATGYFVWRNDSNDAASALSLAAVVGTNYDDTSARSNVSYYYWVQATNAAGPGGTNSFSAPDTGYWAQWYYVATNGDDSASGIDWSTPLATISNGAAKAHRWLGGGVIVSNGTYNLTVQLTLSNAVWVRSFSGETNTVIDGGGTIRCVYITNAILDGFTVTNAGLVDAGGGVYIRYTGQVWNCTLTGNRVSSAGGGIYFYGGGVATNCRIVGNVSTGTPGVTTDAYGGGAYCYSGGLLTNCAISFNVATNTNPIRSAYGGGVYCSSAAGTVINCLVYTNSAAGSGGGIYGGTVLNSLIVSNQGVIGRNNNHGGGGCASCTIVSNCTIIWNSCANGRYGSGGAASGCTVLRNCTNISFNSARRPGGVEVGAGKYLLDSVVFSNWGGDAGGGVQLTYGGVVSGCVIYGNSVPGPGGGVYCYNWTAGAGPVIQDCLISNNVSSNYGGGGIFFTGYGMHITGAVQRCTIVSNRALGGSFPYGGGIYADTESILVQDCTLFGNTASGYGGGLYHVNNTGTVERCVVQNNQSSWSGGGGYLSRGVTVRNCLFMNNVTINAGQTGGGIYLDRIGNSNGYLSACTIVSNRSSYGGGLCLGNTNNLVVDCVIVSNAATTRGPDLYATTAEQSNSFWNCCVPTNLPAAQGNLEARPPFLDPAAGNWRLAAGSPCINQGLYQGWMAGALDKDGNFRILGGTVDIGAYEYPLYSQVSPLGITNTLVAGVSTGTLVEVWSGDTNAELTYAASSTNEWISLGGSNGAIAVNTTNALWVTNSAAGLAPGVYTGQVYVVSTNSLSAVYPPDTQTVTVIMTVLPLEPPANVQATDGAYADKVVVTWDTNLCTNATGYAVWRSIAADTNSASILSAASDTSYIDTSAANGVLYYYWVQATNAGSFSDLSASNTGYRALSPPMGVTASDGSYSGKVVVTWQTNVCTNAVGYSVWRNTAGDLTSATRLVGVAGTNYEDTSVLSNVLYYYWIQATNTLSQTNASAGGPDTGYWALTYYVATNGSDTNAGINWEMPYATISSAVTQAQRWATGLVLVSNGTYTVTLEVAVTNSIQVRSWNGGAVDRENTVVSGGGAVRGFNVNKAGAVIEGLTVTNCVAPNSLGGGIYLAAGLVTNCVLTGNWATNGGGIALASANAVLKNSLVAGNAASNGGYYTGGGGVYMSAGLVTNCIISNNVARWCGGGVHLEGGKMTDSVIVTNRVLSARFGAGGGGVMVYHNSAATLANCTLTGNVYPTNSAEGGGGGASVMFGGLVTNCMISENYSHDGGGIYFIGNTQNQVIDCVISSNTAYGGGGGVFYYSTHRGDLINCRVVDNVAKLDYGGGIHASGTAILRQLLIAGNSTPNWGGGVYAQGGPISSCTIVSNYAAAGGGIMFINRATAVTNTIIYSNKTGAAWTDIGFFNGTATLYNCCTPVTNTCLVAENCVTNAPQYVNFAAGNFRLGPASPCINNGGNEDWMDTALDLDWRPRIRYGRVDMGCYEYLLNVKVNGVPMDRVLRLNGVDQNRIFRIYE